MSSFGAWSVKGIDDRARAAAKEQARLKGVTLGDYINTLLLQEHDRPDRAPGISPARPLNGLNPASPASEPSAHRQDPVSPIDSLARRIEAAEARSTLAITGIDQSVLGLLTRIETSESNASAIAGEVEGMIDELRQTHEALQNKVRALEHDDTAQKNLQTVKSLEQALAQLANHVHDENMLAQEDSEAIKARIEAGFCEVTDRVDTIEHQIESRLSDAAERVYKVVEKAELRAEGTSKHLSERFTDVEASVARRLAKIDTLASRLSKVEEDVGGVNTLLAQEAHYGARMSQIEDEVLNAVEALEKGLDASQQADIVIAERVGVIEGDVSGAISSMEETLLRIQDRLNRAETTTDSALKALEETFANLDKRIESIALNSDPAIADSLRDTFEQKFEDLASELRTTVENTRLQLAKEIEKAIGLN